MPLGGEQAVTAWPGPKPSLPPLLPAPGGTHLPQVKTALSTSPPSQTLPCSRVRDYRHQTSSLIRRCPHVLSLMATTPVPPEPMGLVVTVTLTRAGSAGRSIHTTLPLFGGTNPTIGHQEDSETCQGTAVLHKQGDNHSLKTSGDGHLGPSYWKWATSGGHEEPFNIFSKRD